MAIVACIVKRKPGIGIGDGRVGVCTGEERRKGGWEGRGGRGAKEG